MEHESSVDQFMNRRSFLRSAFGVGVGIVVGAAVEPYPEHALNEYVADATHHPTGAAGIRNRVETECASQPNPKQCVEEWQPSPGEAFQLQVVGPVIEEVAFRAVPSVMVDSIDPKWDDDPMAVVLAGTKEFRFTRKELIGGVISAILFGAAHNVTQGGFDTQNIPAGQTVGGLVYWYLMRRFGIGASIASHAAYNARVIRMK